MLNWLLAHRHWGGIVLIVGLIAAVVMAVFGVYSYRRPLPQTEGAIYLEGLSEPVTIYRDSWGVPHIYAATLEDLLFAQGYVHAQDRWWQMEINRHLGYGRLSEITGNDKSIQDTDQLIRALGWSNHAETLWASASPSLQTLLRAYAEGANQYIQEHDQGDLAIQYTILGLAGRGFEVRPWHPVDSLAWSLAHQWQNSYGFTEAYQLAQRYSEVPVSALDDYLTPHPRMPTLMNAIDPDQMVIINTRLPTPPSSAWVVNGEHTNSGAPLLANNLVAPITIPSPWYEVGLHCIEPTPDCPLNVVGMSLSGMPGIWAGYNSDIAWGISYATTPTQHIHRLSLNPRNPTQYRTSPEAPWQTMTTRTDEIQINNARPLPITVYETTLGVVISDVRQGQTDGLALDWALPNTAQQLEAILALNQATHWTDVTTALAEWGSPPLSLMYADQRGNIGQIITQPDGPPQTDYNPPTGWLISPGAASERLTTLLMTTDQHTPDTFAAIQADTFNPFAADFIPHVLALDLNAPDQTKLQDYQNWLKAWDFHQDRDSPQAVLFALIWADVVERVFDDQLLIETGGLAAEREAIFNLLDRPSHPWWDDLRTPDMAETRDETLTLAFQTAISAAEDEFGAVRSRWQWDDLHQVDFNNPVLGKTRVAAIEDLLNRENIGISGGVGTLHAAPWSTHRLNRYAVTSVTAARLLLHLSADDQHRSILSTGQSGHPASPHYDDMIPLWLNLTYRDMLWDFETIRRSSDSVLTLYPAPTIQTPSDE